MLVVVGSGRSGTSAVAHAATTRLGYCFGELSPPTRANPLGAYECRHLTAITKDRLHGGTAEAWADAFREYVQAREEPAGLKDPQLAFFLDEALEILGEVDVVWADRDLEAAIQSRMKFGFVNEDDIRDAFIRRREKIETTLAGKRYLQLSFDHRWSPDDIAGMLHGFVEFRGSRKRKKG